MMIYMVFAGHLETLVIERGYCIRMLYQICDALMMPQETETPKKPDSLGRSIACRYSASSP